MRCFLRQTVILKLERGLGPRLGLEKAKSLLRFRGDLTFLDIIVKQFLYLRANMAPGLSLYFMNSFSTSEDTIRALQAYSEPGDTSSMEGLQSRVPKIEKKTLLPISWPPNPTLDWGRPGHAQFCLP